MDEIVMKVIEFIGVVECVGFLKGNDKRVGVFASFPDVDGMQNSKKRADKWAEDWNNPKEVKA